MIARLTLWPEDASRYHLGSDKENLNLQLFNIPANSIFQQATRNISIV